MIRIEKRMGAKIIRHMETILHRPDKTLLCARYSNGSGAIQAFYTGRYEKNTVSWYWYKLKEEVKNPLTDTARIMTIHESKMRIDEFLKFLTDEKAPVFKVTAQFEQAIRNAMPSEFVLDFAKAGINLQGLSDMEA